METNTSSLNRPEFPRSNGYDTNWVLENQMGPNPLWLAEWLTEKMVLKPGMRVLDLGCGRALTSIFLAKEFEVQVWAADLWIGPDNNRRRAEEAGVADRVFPVRAEAHALPFATDFFDAVVSVDAYHYFGTDVLYLSYLANFLRPGGFAGIVVPGFMKKVDRMPEHLTKPQSNGKVFWDPALWSFKTAAWWQRHWARSGCVENVEADTLPDGWRHWRDFEQAVETSGNAHFPSDAEALEADHGETIGFIRAVARRSDNPSENLYDPDLAANMGIDT